MLDQFVSMMLISIVLTFIAFLSARALIRYGQIKHPKTRFFIHMTVVFIAISLSFGPIVSESLFSSFDNTNASGIEIQTPPVFFTVSTGDVLYNYQTPLKNLFNATNTATSSIVENNDLSSEDTINSSIQEAVCAAILYEKFFKHNGSYAFDAFLNQYDLQLDEEKIHSSSMSFILNEIISLYSNANLNNLSSNTITCKFLLNTELDPPSTLLLNENNHQNKTVFIPILLLFLLILICGILYFFFSLFLGKRITLKSVDAQPCTDKKTLLLIHEISTSLGIKPPRVFIMKGPPNAFIFGYPTTIVLSRTLLKILNKKELEMALRHELSHIKNKDFIIKPALQMLRLLLFFNPSTHFTLSHMMKEREALADFVSFSEKKDKITFVEALIKIEEYLAHFPSTYISQSPRFSLALWDHTKKHIGLEERFTRLFDEKKPNKARSIFICFLLVSTNISLITFTMQRASINYNNPPPVVSKNFSMVNESYLYECTFFIGKANITYQEVSIFKSNTNQEKWVRYETEILPLTSYILKLYLKQYPQLETNSRITSTF